jgi:asparagine synthase (glutamine-hydrolysing)
VEDLVASRAFRERGIYDVARVRAILDEHQRIVDERQPVDNHMMFLWQLVNLELWLRG